MKINEEEVRELYESVESVWPSNDKWHLYSKNQIESYLHAQKWSADEYVLNAGSGGNSYQLSVNMHHRDLAKNKIAIFDDYSVGSIETLPQNDATFDSIICVGSVINYCDAVSVISEFARVIKSNGVLYLEFESSMGYEHRKTHEYGAAAAIVKLRYFDELWSQWIYNPEYIQSILSSHGFKILDDYRFHILSAYAYSNCQNENKAAKYAACDKILRHFPCKKHANNVLFKCIKL